MNACWVWVLAGEHVNTGRGHRKACPVALGSLLSSRGRSHQETASKGVRGQAALIREYAESRARGVPSGARVTL